MTIFLIQECWKSEKISTKFEGKVKNDLYLMYYNKVISLTDSKNIQILKTYLKK